MSLLLELDTIQRYQEYLRVLKTSFDHEFPNKTGNSPRTRVLASSPSLHTRENSEDKTSSGPTPLPVKLEAPPQTSSSKGKGVQPVSDHLPAQISTVIPTELYRNQMRRQGSSSFGSRPSSFDSSKRSRLESRSPSATSGKAIGIPHQQ
nr:hypothetical protein Iba_chr12dCG1320 [Ipomoea batatas]